MLEESKLFQQTKQKGWRQVGNMTVVGQIIVIHFYPQNYTLSQLLQGDLRGESRIPNKCECNILRK